MLVGCPRRKFPRTARTENNRNTTTTPTPPQQHRHHRHHHITSPHHHQQRRTNEQVRWDIVDDDGSAYTKWWGARIMRMVAPPPGQLGPVYVIAYDPEEGFEAEERTIRITSLRE